MAEPIFSLDLATPDALIHHGRVTALVAPAAEGYLGVLAGHARLRAALTIGKLRVDPVGDEPRWLAVSGGLLEVDRDRVTVLADSAEPAEEIDVERAQAARRRAEERLAGQTTPSEAAEAGEALRRAINRIEVARLHGT